ncbi:MAG: serine hydrolase domain-containing protein [Planctomycetota bacterium]
MPQLLKTAVAFSLLSCWQLAALAQTAAPETAAQLETIGLAPADPATVGMSSEKLDLVMPAVQQLIDEQAIAGAVVGVARRGRLVLLEAAGSADVEKETPLETDSIVRIYSMTKPVTSVAVMMLVEEGKLALDDPVAKHLPQFEPLQAYAAGEGEDLQTEDLQTQPTVRDLLRHTAGLTYGIFGNTPVDKLYRKAGILSPVLNLEKTVDRIAKLPLLYQPRERFTYSVATDVLGRLVEVKSATTLDRFFAERIFEPLGMEDTGFYAPKGEADRLASSYGNKPSDGGLTPIDVGSYSMFRHKPLLLSGGGGLVSTAGDYLRFLQMLLNEGELDGTRLLEPQSVAEMTRNQLPDAAYPLDVMGVRPGVGFGLGFYAVVERTDYNKESAIGEYGWDGAASTHFWVSPEDELAVVALSQKMPFTFRLKEAVQPLVYNAIVD